MKKVAIWGSYEHGNYGDDLMAVIFANHLKNMGIRPVVYRLNNKVAEQYSIDTTDNIDDLFSDCAFAILGGGGMLVTDSLLRRTFSKVSRSFEKDFKDLYQALKKYGTSFFPISIGGNGYLEESFKLASYRNKVFKSDCCKKGTLRLESDAHWGKRLDIDFTCVPDVLLSTAKQFPDIEKKQSDKLVVGVNLVGDCCQPFVDKLEKFAKQQDKIEFVYINTHLDGYGHNYELTPSSGSNKLVRTFQHNQSFERTLELLSSLDLLISSKLHLGLTALTFQTPFVSFCGKSKTESFLSDVSVAKTTFKEKDEQLLLDMVQNVDEICFDELFDRNKIQEFSRKSMEHFDFIDTIK